MVEVALQWCSSVFSDTLVGFVNSVKTIDGGTHMDGLKAALTRLVNGLARKTKALKEGDANLSGDHVREGLTAVVSVKVGFPLLQTVTLGSQMNPHLGGSEGIEVLGFLFDDHLSIKIYHLQSVDLILFSVIVFKG